MVCRIILIILSGVCMCCGLICSIMFFIDENVVQGIIWIISAIIWNVNLIIYTHWVLKDIEKNT